MAKLEDRALAALANTSSDNPLHKICQELLAERHKLDRRLDRIGRISDGYQTQLRELHAALAQSQAQVIQSSKMAAIGQLAGGVAHELNTPLASVLMCLDSSLKILPDKPDRAAGRLERARNSVLHMRDLISKLLFYSRDAVDVLAPTDLNQVVEDTLQIVGHQFQLDNLDLNLELGPVPSTVANANQLQQVVTNLLVNARDALATVAGPRSIHISTQLLAGETLELTVKDNGPGIEPRVLDRVFEPFFTTKEVGSGTGLGLSVSLQLVQQHGGTLTVASEPGQGAEFTMRLPLRPEE